MHKRNRTQGRLEGGFFVYLTETLVQVPLPALVIQPAQEQGAGIADLLSGTGLRPENFVHPDTRLSYTQIAVIVARAMEQTRDPGFGLTFGQRIRLSHLAELGTALGCAPTLGEALRTTIRYQKLLGSAFDMRLVDFGEQLGMVASKSIPLGANYRFNQETWLTTIARLSVRLIERELPELRADFDYPAPAYAPRYRAVFGTKVKFRQSSCQVVFPKRLLAQPLPGASPACFRVALANCDKALSANRIPQSLPARVRQLIRVELGDPPQAETVARALNLSVRSLHRRLTDLDTSYRQLLNEEKSAAAISFLRESTLPVKTIAARLGFGDPSNFVKAFRAWTGTTPQQFRGS